VTVTLDGKTLNVLALAESADIVASQRDAWENGAYKKKMKVYGVIRQWTLDCVENSVAWASSQAKSFEDTMTAGTTVAFSVTDEVRAVSTNVKITGVGLNISDLGGKNVRHFRVSMQEV
jgi:hypothetical protein